MAHHKKGHHHTGKIAPEGHHAMKSKKHDGMAHPSHHTANKEHDMHDGFAPGEGYEDGGCDHHLGDNVAEED